MVSSNLLRLRPVQLPRRRAAALLLLQQQAAPPPRVEQRQLLINQRLQHRLAVHVPGPKAPTVRRWRAKSFGLEPHMMLIAE